VGARSAPLTPLSPGRHTSVIKILTARDNRGAPLMAVYGRRENHRSDAMKPGISPPVVCHALAGMRSVSLVFAASREGCHRQSADRLGLPQLHAKLFPDIYHRPNILPQLVSPRTLRRQERPSEVRQDCLLVVPIRFPGEVGECEARGLSAARRLGHSNVSGKLLEIVVFLQHGCGADDPPLCWGFSRAWLLSFWF